MAAQIEGVGRDDVKTHFNTREGSYKLVTLAEFARPTRLGYNTQGNTPVKVSYVSLPHAGGECDHVCCNYGKELYVCEYRGIKKGEGSGKAVDKRMYKGTNPTCHAFNPTTVRQDCAPLLVGFSGGQIQLCDPVKKELSQLFNEERLIDKTKVTSVKWVPGSVSEFLASHSSGQMYVYNEELPCGSSPPSYHLVKHGDGYSVSMCKTKSTRNPTCRWIVGDGSINEFEFSPCCNYLAVVSQDGCLRVFNYASMELVGMARSYFGGLLCVCWSPDGKFIVTGGEDDLVTVWSLQEKRVVARGQGHKSWVSVVAFDSYTTSCGDSEEDADKQLSELSNLYRFGSVGQDTQLCLWDLTEDVLKQPYGRSRTSVHLGSSDTGQQCNSLSNSIPKDSDVSSGSGSLSRKFSTLNVSEKKDGHKRNFSKGKNGWCVRDDPVRMVGSVVCPRMDEIPTLEPLVCKKISHERLTALLFLEDCMLTAGQDGLVCIWSRPGKTVRHETE